MWRPRAPTRLAIICSTPIPAHSPEWRSAPARTSLASFSEVDLRASVLPTDKVIEEAAFDKYTYIRDAYLQHRRNEIFDGDPPRIPVDY